MGFSKGIDASLVAVVTIVVVAVVAASGLFTQLGAGETFKEGTNPLLEDADSQNYLGDGDGSDESQGSEDDTEGSGSQDESQGSEDDTEGSGSQDETTSVGIFDGVVYTPIDNYPGRQQTLSLGVEGTGASSLDCTWDFDNSQGDTDAWDRPLRKPCDESMSWVYSSTGSYTPTATVENSEGETKEYAGNVEIEEPPSDEKIRPRLDQEESNAPSGADGQIKLVANLENYDPPVDDPENAENVKYIWDIEGDGFGEDDSDGLGDPNSGVDTNSEGERGESVEFGIRSSGSDNVYRLKVRWLSSSGDYVSTGKLRIERNDGELSTDYVEN
jgi:hypothetical protein